MQKQNQDQRERGEAKKPYIKPELVSHGTVEKNTHQIGGPSEPILDR